MEELNLLEAKKSIVLKGSPTESKRSYWFNLLKEFEESGLTQKQFSELHGLKLKTLSRWKNKFKRTKEKSSKRKEVCKLKETINAEEPINFLSLELSERIKVEEKSLDKIVFCHESGFRLEFEERSNKELFRSGLLMLLELTRC
jgi:transcriptional regulator with XRE-family HTH domain